MKKILIADTTVLTTYGTFGFKEAVEAARKLSDLNVDIIELPKIENKAKDTLFIKTISSFIKNSIISVNAGNTPEEISTAANALNGIKNARLRIELPLSDVNMEYSLHKKGKVMESFAVSLFEEAQKTNIDTEFCALDATRADKELLKSVLSAAITHGVKTVSVYDNEGILFPDSFADFVNDTFKDLDVTDVNVGVCVNNINGFALSCSFLAAKGKANVIKVSAIDNITPLKDVVKVLKNCSFESKFESSLNYTKSGRILSQIDWILNKESIKVIEKAPENRNVSLNAFSDFDTVMAEVLQLGYDLSKEDQKAVFEEFKRIAQKKDVTSKELDAIVASAAMQVPATYKLEHYIIQTGNVLKASAQIVLKKNGEKISAISMGDGPIDAAFCTLEKAMGKKYELQDFQIQAITRGQEAMGSAVVKLKNGGKIYSGNGLSTDIISSSIRAYINAVNKIVYEEE